MRPERERRAVLDFVSKRYLYFALSAVVLIAGVISLAIPPALKVGIDFRSGSVLEVQFGQEADQGDLRDLMADQGHPDAKIQRTGSTRFLIQTKTLAEGQIDPQFEAELNSQLQELAPNGFTVDRAAGDILTVTIFRDLAGQELEQKLEAVAQEDFALQRERPFRYALTLKRELEEAVLRQALTEFIQDDFELERTGASVFKLAIQRFLLPDDFESRLRELFPEEEFGLSSVGENAFQLTLLREVSERGLQAAIQELTQEPVTLVRSDGTVYTLTFQEEVAEADLRGKVQDFLRSKFTIGVEDPEGVLRITFDESVSEADLRSQLLELPPEPFAVEAVDENSYALVFAREIPEEELRTALEGAVQEGFALARNDRTTFSLRFTEGALAAEGTEESDEGTEEGADQGTDPREDNLRSAITAFLLDDFSLEQVGVAAYRVVLTRDLAEERLRELLAELPPLDFSFFRAGDTAYELVFPGEKSNILKSLGGTFGDIQSFEFNSVTPLVAARTTRVAGIAVGVASIAILFYVTWAFRRMPRPFRWGVAALVALAHDVLVTLGLFSILGKTIDAEVNLMFITGILTVVGFSVHDTIVVFDRIRENMTRNVSARFDTTVNISVVETVGRSISTSVTLLFTVVAILIFGGSTLRDFMLVFLIGIVTGTYSSIFIAAQVLVAWEKGELAVPLRFALSPARWLWAHFPLRRRAPARAS